MTAVRAAQVVTAAREIGRCWRAAHVAARLVWIWAELWLVAGVAAVGVWAVGGWPGALVAAAAVAAGWRSRAAQVKNVGDTVALALAGRRHWRRFCDDAGLTVQARGRTRYPPHRTTVAPVVWRPGLRHPRLWARPTSITHRVLPLADHPDIRSRLEAAALTFYDYPSVTSKLDGNWVAVTVTLDELPFVVTLDD